MGNTFINYSKNVYVDIPLSSFLYSRLLVKVTQVKASPPPISFNEAISYIYIKIRLFCQSLNFMLEFPDLLYDYFFLILHMLRFTSCYKALWVLTNAQCQCYYNHTEYFVVLIKRSLVLHLFNTTLNTELLGNH